MVRIDRIEERKLWSLLSGRHTPTQPVLRYPVSGLRQVFVSFYRSTVRDQMVGFSNPSWHPQTVQDISHSTHIIHELTVLYGEGYDHVSNELGHGLSGEPSTLERG